MAKVVSKETKSLTDSAKERYDAIKGIIAEKKAKIEEYEQKIASIMEEVKAVRTESAPLLAYLKRAGIVEKGKRAKKEPVAEPNLNASETDASQA